MKPTLMIQFRVDRDYPNVIFLYLNAETKIESAYKYRTGDELYRRVFKNPTPSSLSRLERLARRRGESKCHPRWTNPISRGEPDI